MYVNYRLPGEHRNVGGRTDGRPRIRLACFGRSLFLAQGALCVLGGLPVIVPKKVIASAILYVCSVRRILPVRDSQSGMRMLKD